jgi:asparagine synthase (glutamine-hydrolysing)
VRELAAGHWARLTRDGWTERRWWRMPFTAGAKAPVRPAEAADRLREALRAATSIRLRADVPVGAYVSGGIDSSLLASLIKDENPGMQTFSIRFADQAFDEGRYQDLMVRHLGSEHHVVTVGSADIARAFPRLVRHAARPVLRTAPTPMMLLAEKVREVGIKVVLTGEGADEVMAGYDLFKDAKIRAWWARHPESRLRPLLLARLYPTNPMLAKAGQADYLHRYYGRWIDSPMDRAFSHRPRWETVTGVLENYLSPALRPLLARVPDWDAQYLESLPVDFDDWAGLDKAQLLEAETLLGGYLLSAQGDRPAMAHSVEGRLPGLPRRRGGLRAARARAPTRAAREAGAQRRGARGAARRGAGAAQAALHGAGRALLFRGRRAGLGGGDALARAPAPLWTLRSGRRRCARAQDAPPQRRPGRLPRQPARGGTALDAAIGERLHRRAGSDARAARGRFPRSDRAGGLSPMPLSPDRKPKGLRRMNDIVGIALFLVAWFALQRWVLPRMGVST